MSILPSKLSAWEDFISLPSDIDVHDYTDAPDYDPDNSDNSDDSWFIVMPYMSKKNRSTSSAGFTKKNVHDRPCDHWMARQCSVATFQRCCACADERPTTDSGLYPMYADGRGWIEGATRWAYYCPGCKQHHAAEYQQQIMENLRLLVKQKILKRQREAKLKCQHWLERDCSMTMSSGNCCSCADSRPVLEYELYPAYVDGVGWVANATRWAYYCPGCKAKEEADHDVCEHFYLRDCALGGTDGRCCSCADQRPITQSGLYSMYVDGQGFVENAPRWNYYCPACREAHKEAVPKQVLPDNDISTKQID
ncbi:hypothetical protein BX600DRAFT_109192 [Xylariales sp. PMI_506]|nr:hypothetical protein BX600DRAFT_109192 [Xylariales sp. PMI_506]